MTRFRSWILTRLFSLCIPKEYTGINKETMHEWLVLLQRNDGFKAYYQYRYFEIMSMLAAGVVQEKYWELVGRRKELLHLSGESKYRDDLEGKEKKKNLTIKKNEI